MSTYKEHRRENLLALERQYGSLEALSDAVGVSASYLSQMKKIRHMGDRVARRIEKKIGLQPGSMDQPPGQAATASVVSGGGAKMQVPHYSPDQGVQDFLNDYLGIPAGLRSYLQRKAKELRSYSEQLTPFQRNNFPEPPSDAAGYAAWVKELEEELARSEQLTPSSARTKAKIR